MSNTARALTRALRCRTAASQLCAVYRSVRSRQGRRLTRRASVSQRSRTNVTVRSGRSSWRVFTRRRTHESEFERVELTFPREAREEGDQVAPFLSLFLSISISFFLSLIHSFCLLLSPFYLVSLRGQIARRTGYVSPRRQGL